MYEPKEAQVRSQAARWAAALLDLRASNTLDEQELLVDLLQANAADTPSALCSALWAALERDDEDTDETARLVFEALGSKNAE